MSTMRLLTLTLAWAWSVTAGSLGLNALIKSNHEKSQLKAFGASKGIVVDIDTNDVFRSGTSATAAATFVGLFISLLVTPAIVAALQGKSSVPSRRTLRIEATVLSLSALWMIASLVPYTLFFATRSARVTAFVGGKALPPAIIQATQQALHATPVYREKSYLRLFAIIPWIATLAIIIAACTSLATISSVKETPPWSSAEKASNGHQEEAFVDTSVKQ